MGSVGRSEVLRLYKSMLRESQKFPSYNYKHYAVRRVRDAFKENRTLQDPSKVSEQLNKAYKNLDIIKRQVIVGGLYQTNKLIIEQRVAN